MQLKIWELCEYYIMEVVTLEGEAFRVVQCLVNELTFFLIDNVVVANELLVPLSLAHFVGFRSNTTRDESVTDSNKALLNKIHFIYLLVLIVNYLVINVVLKMPGKEALGNFEEQADVLLLVQGALGVIEKTSKSCYHIFK